MLMTWQRGHHLSSSAPVSACAPFTASPSREEGTQSKVFPSREAVKSSLNGTASSNRAPNEGLNGCLGRDAGV